MISRLLKRTSECAWLPLSCRLMSLNDSNGILSAMPCVCRRLRRCGEDDDDAVLSSVSLGVTKYDKGMYLLVVASRTVGSWPSQINLSNS